MMYNIFTDGSCDHSSEGREGGYAFTIYDKDMGERLYAFAAGALDTTNNTMELTAIVEACKVVGDCDMVRVHSDSQYAINVLTGRCSPMANQDIVDEHHRWNTCRLAIDYVWVHGHSRDPYNDEVDSMADKALNDMRHEASRADRPAYLARWRQGEIATPRDIGRKEIHWAGALPNVFEGNPDEFVPNSGRLIAIIDAMAQAGSDGGVCAHSICCGASISFSARQVDIHFPTPNRLLLTSLSQCLDEVPDGADADIYSTSDYIVGIMAGKFGIRSSPDIVLPLLSRIKSLGRLTFRLIDNHNADFMALRCHAKEKGGRVAVVQGTGHCT